MSTQPARTRLAPALMVLAALMSLGACGSQTQASVAPSLVSVAPSATVAASAAGAPTTCEEAFAIVQDAATPTDEQLNALVLICGSVEQISLTAQDYPGVIDDADAAAWVRGRCETMADRDLHAICDH